MIRLNEISKTYGGRKVLRLAKKTLDDNTIYAIIGANGSGKSTFSKILCGIDKADGGKHPLTGSFTTGYMSQQNYAFRMSVRKNILQNKEDGSALQLADHLMGRMNLTALADKPAKKLSGGETARMALCRILMKKYDILILDEATASMDMESALAAEALIREYQEKYHCTVLFITHSIPQAARIADKVLFFHEGEIVEEGHTAQVLHQPESKELKEFLKFSGHI